MAVHKVVHPNTAAHRTLPFGTMVRVTNKRNGKSVVVRINDRGPFSSGRIMDVSYAAAHRLGFVEEALANVEVESIVPAMAQGAPVVTFIHPGGHEFPKAAPDLIVAFFREHARP